MLASGGLDPLVEIIARTTTAIAESNSGLGVPAEEVRKCTQAVSVRKARLRQRSSFVARRRRLRCRGTARWAERRRGM